MTVTIFGATGMVGKQVITHAMAKGWAVRAFGRNAETMIDKENQLGDFTAVKGYVFNTADVHFAIKGSDAVLSVLGGSFDGTDKTRSLGMKNIVSEMQAAGVKRIVALGGLGVLPDANGGYLMDDPDYPAEYLPVGEEHKQAYQYLAESNLDWTFVCSPNIVDGDGDNEFDAKPDEKPEGDEISNGNLALFMVEELERGEFINKRVGIANK